MPVRHVLTVEDDTDARESLAALLGVMMADAGAAKDVARHGVAEAMTKPLDDRLLEVVAHHC